MNMPRLHQRLQPAEAFLTRHFFKEKIFLLLFFLLACSSIFSQQLVTGVVAGGDTCLSGVTVKVKGTAATSITDNSGRFSINASPTATLVFSSVGYASQDVPVNNRTTIQVSLVSTSERLNEVIVTGY